jgi:topoisomerase-4 subunit A
LRGLRRLLRGLRRLLRGLRRLLRGLRRLLVEPVELKDALEERYLAYALSTIMHRALPDVRDGLKPVHRRILHAMRAAQARSRHGLQEMRPRRRRRDRQISIRMATSRSMTRWCASRRISRSAIRWSTGRATSATSTAITPAAMRYTEARMTDVAALLLEGIDEDAVDFRPTYDGEEQEPIVLPAAFPNLLANGSHGHRRRHGDLHSAAQRGRTLRSCAASDRDPKATIDEADVEFVPGRISRPAASSSTTSRERSAKPTTPGAAAFRVRAAGRRKTPAAAAGIVVTEIPYLGAEGRG